MSNRKKLSSEPILSRYMHKKGAVLGLPVSGTFELTPRCNFNCKMCYVHMTNEEIRASGRKELSANQWLNLASDARDAGMLFLLLTGGEPFTRDDFEEIYIELKKMGLMVSINSNGSLLDKERMALILANPPSRMNVTLYGGSDATYEKLCGRPVFHKVINNVQRLKEAGISVRLNLSVTPDNCEDIENLYEIGKKLGTHIKSTTYMFPSIRLGDNIPGKSGGRFSSEDAAKYMIKCQEQYLSKEQLQAMAGRQLLDYMECSEEDRQGIRCRAGRSSFWMTWDGLMMPCGMMNDRSQNVLEKGFIRCWNSVKEKTSSIKLPVACSGCSYREICNVCAASCYAETGGFTEKPEYICDFVKHMDILTKEKYAEDHDECNL